MTISFDLIGITVIDMSRALAFYRLVGLDVPASAEAEPHVEFTLPGGLRIAWDTVETIRSFDPQWQPPTGNHRVAFAFKCDSPAEVDRVYAEITGAGYDGHAAPWDAFWGQRYATLIDPDGNGIDLFAPLT
jgi:uncharacterized glyoxalase superfamily protein PhnB